MREGVRDNVTFTRLRKRGSSHAGVKIDLKYGDRLIDKNNRSRCEKHFSML